MGLTDIRKKALKIFDDAKIPPIPQFITSNGATKKQFSDLTGGAPFTVNGKTYASRHELLWENWEGGGKMTACNEFVGWFGRQLGLKDNVGRFDIEEQLDALKMRHAWVKPVAGVPPKPGDILRHTAFHMDIALDFKDGILYRVAAGQGGPQRDKDKKLIGGADILKRVKGDGPYDYHNLQGWLDIDLLFPAPTPPATPSSGTTGSLWLNDEGDLVHPHAPDGAGGPGFFRVAGSLAHDPDDLPHPKAPAARRHDPLATGKWEEEFRKDADRG